MLTSKAFASVVLVAGLALASCAQQPSTVGEVAVPQSFAESTAVFLSEVETLQTQLNGTPLARARSELAAAEREQSGYRDCMGQGGFVYDVPNLVLSPQPMLYEPSWWSRPSLSNAARGLGYASAPQPVASPKPNHYEKLSPDRKAVYDAALNKCFATVGNQPDLSGPPNPSAVTLLHSLDAALTAASATPAFVGLKARYKSCMKAKEISVEQPGDLYAVAKVRLGDLGLLSIDPYSQKYADLLPQGRSVEVDLSMADVQCRAPLADEVAAELSPALEKWLVENGATARAAGQLWTGPSESPSQ